MICSKTAGPFLAESGRRRLRGRRCATRSPDNPARREIFPGAASLPESYAYILELEPDGAVRERKQRIGQVLLGMGGTFGDEPHVDRPPQR